MERRRRFLVLAEKGGVIEYFEEESEEALRERIGSREVIRDYTTTACSDCDENSCTKGPGRGALEMRSLFTIERMCSPATSGKWLLAGGADPSRYSLSFQTKEDLVEFLDAMPHSWHDYVPDMRWDLAISATRHILNVPRLKLVK